MSDSNLAFMMAFPKIGLHIPVEWIKVVGSIHKRTNIMMPDTPNDSFKIKTSHTMRVKALVGPDPFNPDNKDGIQVDADSFSVDPDRIISLEDSDEIRRISSKRRKTVEKCLINYTTAMNSALTSQGVTQNSQLGSLVSVASTSLASIARDKREMELRLRKIFNKRKTIAQAAPIYELLGTVVEKFDNHDQVIAHINRGVAEFMASIWQANTSFINNVNADFTSPAMGNDDED